MTAGVVNLILIILMFVVGIVGLGFWPGIGWALCTLLLTAFVPHKWPVLLQIAACFAVSWVLWMVWA